MALLNGFTMLQAQMGLFNRLYVAQIQIHDKAHDQAAQAVTVLTQFNYIIVIILMMLGLYVVFAAHNLIKKLVGLSVFQTSVFLLYITIGKVANGLPPILVDDHGHEGSADVSHKTIDHKDTHHKAIDHADINDAGSNIASAASDIDLAVSLGHSAPPSGEVLYSNPLPHVLILTAIVVGVATLAIGLSLVVRIRETYGTIEDDKIAELDFQYNLEGLKAL